MTFNQLNIFCQIVEFGSVTRASKHLGIPQPAASRVIRSLEKEFGLPLFDTVGRGMVVNNNGRLLYDYAKQILQLNTKLDSEMQTKKQEHDTTVSIVVEAGSYLFPHICTAFNSRYEDASFKALHREPSGSAEAGNYPLKLHSSREKPRGKNTVVLADEEIRLAVPRAGPFGSRKEIELSEVRDMGFVSLFKTSGLRQITDFFCHQAGFEPKVIFETDSSSAVTRYVNSGHGIAFIPQLTWPKDDSDENVHLLSISEPKCRRFIILSSAGAQHLSRYEVLFSEFLQKYFCELESKS
ncbi:MAG: LysR family transcriptional regulator [Clostridiaceae bacterium]|jgi:DNA-binding transcriptional LysR family regulator|nr:LysR family transcriptional regulator [Clostridiaceae bacterium]